MQDFLNYVLSLGAWLWFILALILVLLETVLPGIHFIWFGMAAIIVGFLALALDIDWQVQVFIFAVISVVTALLARRFLSAENTATDQPGLNERGSYYVGRIVAAAASVSATAFGPPPAPTWPKVPAPKSPASTAPSSSSNPPDPGAHRTAEGLDLRPGIAFERYRSSSLRELGEQRDPSPSAAPAQGPARKAGIARERKN
jgi:membrane protein implicated in regulation of membrane protease activity